MKRITHYLLGLIAVFILFSTSCDWFGENNEISADDIVLGLKTALEVGTDTACSDLHVTNGYYGNALVKILLPEQAKVIFEALNDPIITALGLDQALQRKIDTVVLAINRAAEDVADDAKPIFIETITNMSIDDGLNILNGTNAYLTDAKTGEFDSLAATHYMEKATRTKLLNLYEPKINTALSKDLGLGFSANEAWNTLIWFYNDYLTTIDPNLQKVENINLSEYSANKGLDGLFLFVGNQEKKIRNNPYDWAIDIIQRVFGSVYKD